MAYDLEKEKRKKEFKKRIYTYVLRLIKFITSIPYNIVVQEIKKQLIRSGTSICANYIEAQGASSKKDYQNFFSYSLKSANETRFWLALLKDSKSIPDNLIVECDFLAKETTEIANIFASSIITMKGKKK